MRMIKMIAIGETVFQKRLCELIFDEIEVQETYRDKIIGSHGKMWVVIQLFL